MNIGNNQLIFVDFFVNKHDFTTKHTKNFTKHTNKFVIISNLSFFNVVYPRIRATYGDYKFDAENLNIIGKKKQFNS